MEKNDSKIYFIFGIHNHQPVGNLSYVFDQAFSECYIPFLSALEKFPAIKTVIHNSGALYDWAEKRFPDWIDKLKNLVKRNQVELTGGGYFEPIFPIISQKDRTGQIQLMNRYLKKTFGVIPGGCWVPERVWMPSLAKTLSDCGLCYTYLDEVNFYQKQNDKNIPGIYVTEDQGYCLVLFAIDEVLAGKIPFIMPEEAIDILMSYKKNKDTLVTFFCDGEKFGLWPGTYDLVYHQKWLERFFTLLEKNSQIETILSKDAVSIFSHKKFVYIKNSTYSKMENWALDWREKLAYQEIHNLLKDNENYSLYKKFIKGEDFRNFFIRYPRLNFMHKRMLSVSKRVNSSLNFAENEAVFLNLWKAQTNCVYWHGLFGGFYLPHLRKACYDYLIKAETYLDDQIGQKIFREDIDCDGYKEVIVRSSGQIYVFSQKGATLDEWSLKSIPLNLINTVERVKEDYHKNAEDGELSKYLIYDNYKKTALLDHILKKDLTLDEFKKQKGVESLAGVPYSYLGESKKDKSFQFGYQDKGLSFEKSINIEEETLKVDYRFDKKNTLNNSHFGIECNLSLSGLNSLIIENLGETVINLGQAQHIGCISSLVIFDKKYGLRLRFDFNQAKVYTNPIYTLSSSESGQDLLFQQLSLLFILEKERDSFSLKISLEESISES